MSDLEHRLPPRTPGTSAATPSTKTEADWRSTTQQLLLVLAVAATLPRVLWTSALALNDGFASLSLFIGPLRVISLVADVAVVVMVARLSLLDQRPEGREAAGPRRAAFMALLVDVVWSIGRGVLLEFIPTDVMSSPVARVALFISVSATADLIFALWIARLLWIQKVQAFLPAVVIVAGVGNVVASFVGGANIFWTVMNIAVVFAMLVELMRVRRALA